MSETNGWFWIVLVVGAFAAWKFRGRILAGISAAAPEAAPVVNAAVSAADTLSGAVLKDVSQIEDAVLSSEFISRMRKAAEDAHAKAVADEVIKAAMARMTPIISTMPVTTTDHPAAATGPK